jgi:hypothetical protein
MAAWRPLKRREFMRKLRVLGFAGPYSGTRHQFMVLNSYRQTIPTNPEYFVPQIRMLARQVEAIVGRTISLEEWESL